MASADTTWPRRSRRGGWSLLTIVVQLILFAEVARGRKDDFAVGADESQLDFKRCLEAIDYLTPRNDFEARKSRFEECLHHSYSNGLLSEEENEVTYQREKAGDDLESYIRTKRTKRSPQQPPQVDENIVSAFLNNPEAVKMVLSFLNKNKPPPQRTTTRRPFLWFAPPAPRRPTKPPKPPKTTISSLKDDFEWPPPVKNKKKKKRPSLQFLFGGGSPLAEAIEEHRDNVKRIKENEWRRDYTTPSTTPTTTTTTSTPTHRPNIPARSPPQNHLQKGDMQFFGPKDYVPQATHKLPNFRPMRLRYTSTKEFPRRRYRGRLVPMPR